MLSWTARLLLVAGLAVIAAACGAAAGDDDAAFEPDPSCFGVHPVSGDLGDIRCGYVTVPLDHANPDGPTIRLAVAVLPATDPDAGDDPVIVLEGGPGGHLVEPALSLPPHREQLQIGPETVLMDQRGVGLSEPALECPGYDEATEAAATHPEAVADGVEALADCYDELVEQDIDPQAFHSEAIAADVDLVREALGYEQVHLRGGSYGAEVALRAADAHPDRVASLLLSSPVDPTVNWIAQAPATLDRALNDLARACAGHDGCAARFGDLRERIEQAMERLAEEPAEVPVRRLDGSSDVVTYPAAAAAGHLRWLLYLPPALGSDRLPALIDAAADGNYTPLATLGQRLEQQVVGLVSHGLHHAVRCTGQAADLSAADLRAAAEATHPQLVAEHLLPAETALLDVCDAWDVEPAEAVAPPSSDEPVDAASAETEGSGTAYEPVGPDVPIAPDVPALVVTGQFDPVTAPAYGRRIADRLADSVLVEVPDVGHGALEHLDACGQRIATAFIADPTATGELDVSCATDRVYEPAMELAPVLDLGG